MKVICPKFYECKTPSKKGSSIIVHCLVHDYTGTCKTDCSGNGQFVVYETTPCVEIKKEIKTLLVLMELK